MRVTRCSLAPPRPVVAAVVVFAVAVTWLGHGARADEALTARDRAATPDETALGLASGAACALVPMMIGGALFADRDLDAKQAGIVVMTSGLVVAPLVAHMFVRETKRGALLTLLAGAFGAGLVTLASVNRESSVASTAGARVAFGLLVTGTLGASVGGLVDTLGAPQRARFDVMPMASASSAGVMLGGRFP